MVDPRIIAVVPCRSGSERVKNKNTREFAGVLGGLFRIKLEQLLKVPEIEVWVVTDDPVIRAECVRQAPDSCRLSLLTREAAKSTDALISYIPQAWPNEPDDTVILWTHVTSPLFVEHDYAAAIAMYRRFVLTKNYDSLMTVKRIQDFIWGPTGPINYIRESGSRWPRTQDVMSYWQVSGAAFMAPLSVYREQHDRIGHSPVFYEVGPLKGVEVDTEGDFEFAQALYRVKK